MVVEVIGDLVLVGLCINELIDLIPIELLSDINQPLVPHYQLLLQFLPDNITLLLT